MSILSRPPFSAKGAFRVHVPWEAKQLLKGRYTQAVAAPCRCTVELSSGGIEVIHEKVREWSAGESVSDYVSLDVGAGGMSVVMHLRCHTNSRVGWQEVKVAASVKIIRPERDLGDENPPTEPAVCRLTERGRHQLAARRPAFIHSQYPKKSLSW